MAKSHAVNPEALQGFTRCKRDDHCEAMFVYTRKCTCLLIQPNWQARSYADLNRDRWIQSPEC